LIRRSIPVALLFLLFSHLIGPAAVAQMVLVDKGDQHLTLAGYVDLQYERLETQRVAVDRVFFRRLMLTMNGTATRNWNGVFQFDLAPATAGGTIVFKDVYLQYLGWASRGLTLQIGNQKMPFSRSVLASSSRRNVVERPFTGERASGSPGRALAIKMDGWHVKRTLYWSAALASALHSPVTSEIRVDGLAESQSTWNEGWTTTGRVEWHPLGETPRAQGAFEEDLRVTIGAGALTWRNDGDRNLNPEPDPLGLRADKEAVNGLEISGGLRGRRISVDCEYERVTATTVLPGFSGGLYQAGHARLHKASLEAGYMVLPQHLEIVGAIDQLSADTFESPSRRAAAGVSWYVDGHRLRFQLMHRLTVNDRGISGARRQTSALQAQIAF
jgi:hypothetical protein